MSVTVSHTHTHTCTCIARLRITVHSPCIYTYIYIYTDKHVCLHVCMYVYKYVNLSMCKCIFFSYHPFTPHSPPLEPHPPFHTCSVTLRCSWFFLFFFVSFYPTSGCRQQGADAAQTLWGIGVCEEGCSRPLCVSWDSVCSCVIVCV